MGKVSITLSGIAKAVDNLNYRPGSVKYKAIKAIQSFYTSDDDVTRIQTINTDTLIPLIWDVGDDLRKLKSKRRNFSSIKSAINADLAKLVKKKKKPGKHRHRRNQHLRHDRRGQDQPALLLYRCRQNRGYRP